MSQFRNDTVFVCILNNENFAHFSVFIGGFPNSKNRIKKQQQAN